MARGAMSMVIVEDRLATTNARGPRDWSSDAAVTGRLAVAVWQWKF